MFFDRNEIHIQALVVFSNGNVAFVNPHLRKSICQLYIYIYIQNIVNNHFKKPKTIFRKQNGGFAFQKNRKFSFLDTQISKQ